MHANQQTPLRPYPKGKYVTPLQCKACEGCSEWRMAGFQIIVTDSTDIPKPSLCPIRGPLLDISSDTARVGGASDFFVCKFVSRQQM